MWNLALQLLEDFQHMRGGKSPKLGGGFKYCFIFTPKIGEDFQFDEHIFQMGWFNHHLEKYPTESKFCTDSKVP